MIPKFQDYIKESLWSKGVDRSMSDERRMEDKFTESDLSEFDNKIYTLLDKYNMDDVITDYLENAEETFSQPILDYAKSHGTLRLGFETRDLSNLPDFDYKFHITELKNVEVHVMYDDFDKEFEVMCGNNKDEFNITDTKFGQYLIDEIKKLVKQTLFKHPDVLINNIKKNWKDFEHELYQCVYDVCYSDFMRDKKAGYHTDLHVTTGSTNLNPEKERNSLKRYYFGGVYWKTQPASVLVGNEYQVPNTNPIYKKIINLYKKAFADADRNTQQFERIK